MGRGNELVVACALCLGACAADPAGPGVDGESESGSETGATAPDFFGDRVLNIAHRGGAAEVPEHTLMAYAHAIDVGADVVEIDLQLSADGYAVAIHDDTVERTTEGSGQVDAMSLAELQALDAGYRFTLDEGQSFPHRATGLTIPTLDEVFEAQPQALFAIELKANDTAIAEALAASVQAHDMQAQVFVWSSHVDVTTALRETETDLFVGLNFAEQLSLAGLATEDEATYAAPGPFAQIPLDLNGFSLLDMALVERAHRHEILVHAWTINDPGQMQMLVDWGVDGIITDRPSELAAVLASSD